MNEQLAFQRRGLLITSLCFLFFFCLGLAVTPNPVEWLQTFWWVALGGTASLFWLFIKFLVMLDIVDQLGWWSLRYIWNCYFKWGFQTEFFRYVLTHRNTYARRIEKYIREKARSREFTDKERSRRLRDIRNGYIKGRGLAVYAVWYQLGCEINELEKKRLRTRHAKSRNAAKLRKKGANRAAAAQAVVSQTGASRLPDTVGQPTIDRLRRALDEYQGELPRGIRGRIDDLSNREPHSRDWRLGVRAIEKLLGLVPARKKRRVKGPKWRKKRKPPEWQPEPEEKLVPAATTEELLARLPKTYAWQHVSGEIRYTEDFLKAALGRFLRCQNETVEQVNVLAEQGPDYPSLETRLYKEGLAPPKTPLPCSVSRIARKVRFSYVEEGGVLTVYNIFPRNLTELRMSEGGRTTGR